MIQKYHFKDFLSRYNNEVDSMELFKVLNELPTMTNGMWLAGGAIRRTLIGDLLTSDFDFFFKSEAVLNDYRTQLSNKGAKQITKNNHQETYSIEIDGKARLIQLIKIAYYDTPEQLLDTFDFTISQFAYDGAYLYCGEHSLWDLARKRLALHKLTYGVATMRRLIKYTKQGFTACAGVMQSILEAAIADPSVINSEIQYVD
jgi:hypothetical protein